MKYLTTILLLSALLISGCACSYKAAMETQDKAQNSVVNLGVYDSRAVAIAWVGTESFKQKMNALQDMSEEGETTGDTAMVDKASAEAEALQDRLHKMGFSTAPVTTILAEIEGELPGIMESANVVDIVSKWDEDGLMKYESANQIDVTEMLVDALHPDAKQKKATMGITKRDPVPLKDLEHDD